MKICIVSDYFQPQVGYQEYFIARELSKSGHTVTVVTSDRYFPFPNYEQTYRNVLGKRIVGSGSKKFKDFLVIRLPVILELGAGSLLMLKNIRDTISKIKPDLVIADGIFTPLTWQVALLKKHLKYKLIVDTHASSFNTNLQKSWFTKTYWQIFKILLRPTIEKQTDVFTYVGDSEGKLLHLCYPNSKQKSRLVPLGADTKLFSYSEQSRFKIRKKLGIKTEVLVIYAGKVAPKKDVNILVKALNKLSDNNISLLIIGGGNKKYIQKIKQHAKFKFYVIDFLPNAELPEYFSAADIGVWPGDLSNVILEAMSCRLAVIVPKIVSFGQATDHLASDNAALQFNRGQSDDLASKISNLILKPNLRISRGKNCERLIRSKYAWNELAKKYVELIGLL